MGLVANIKRDIRFAKGLNRLFKRIKPIDAMLHPYFDELRRRKIMINKEQITDLHNFQPEEIAGFESLIKKLTPNWY